MNEFTKLAIANAITTEKASHDFYLQAAGRAVSPETREFFLKLAGDEFEHMSGFIRLYPDGDSEYADLLRGGPAGRSPVHEIPRDEADGIGTCEEALVIALREEQSCIEQYSTLVDAIRDPEMHAMFCKALKDTEQHLKAIESEYARSLDPADSRRNSI